MTRYFTPVLRRSSASRRTQKKGTVGTLAVRKLASDVRKIKRDQRIEKSKLFYRNSAFATIGNAAADSVYVFPFFTYSSWTRVFGTDADDETGKNALIKKTNLDLMINTDGERAAIDYTMFVVQLTKFGHEELYDRVTGGLGALANNVHFSRAGTNGMAFLSQRYFKILAVKRVATGTAGSLPTETISLRKRMYMKFNYNKGNGIFVTNPVGDWRNGISPLAPNTNTYLLCFNNDSTVDSSVKLAINALHTVEV